jgi:hypothetical protein
VKSRGHSYRHSFREVKTGIPFAEGSYEVPGGSLYPFARSTLLPDMQLCALEILHESSACTDRGWTYHGQLHYISIKEQYQKKAGQMLHLASFFGISCVEKRPSPGSTPHPSSRSQGKQKTELLPSKHSPQPKAPSQSRAKVPTKITVWCCVWEHATAEITIEISDLGPILSCC